MHPARAEAKVVARVLAVIARDGVLIRQAAFHCSSSSILSIATHDMTASAATLLLESALAINMTLGSFENAIVKRRGHQYTSDSQASQAPDVGKVADSTTRKYRHFGELVHN